MLKIFTLYIKHLQDFQYKLLKAIYSEEAQYIFLPGQNLLHLRGNDISQIVRLVTMATNSIHQNIEQYQQ